MFFMFNFFQNSYIPPNEREILCEIEEDVEFVTKIIQSTDWEDTPNPPDRQHVVSYPAYIKEMIKYNDLNFQLTRQGLVE